MNPTLPARPSLDSLRKQAKKLARTVTAGDTAALARARAELPACAPPLSQRDAQLILAREYGFAGWADLRAEVLKRTGHGLEWAGAEAERAIHDRDQERLAALLAEHPALLQWRDEDGRTLLHFATHAFSDSGTPEREHHYVRVPAAELLIDAGALVDPELWRDVVTTHGAGMLDLLARKKLLPRNLITDACRGDLDAVRANPDMSELEAAVLHAARFHQHETAALLLDRWIERHRELGARIDAGPGRAGLIAWLDDHREQLGDPWRSYAVGAILQTINDDDLAGFAQRLAESPELLDSDAIDVQVELIERAALHGRATHIAALFTREPAILTAPVLRSSALTFAVEYGHTQLVPLLARIWRLPDDLPHAAALGDLSRVQGWFDAAGRPALDPLARHYPLTEPSTRVNLRWGRGSLQNVLDVALAWACMNKRFEVAEFLIAHGADVNTDWSTHEPAGILHECAVHGNFEAARFLIAHGVDLEKLDYRYSATAAGWAWHAAKDEAMATMLVEAAEKRRKG